MRFGLFGGARTDPGEQASDSRIYSDYIDYICEAEQLHGLQETLGLDGILAELNTGGRIPHDCVVRALQLLCQEVMPRFH